MPERPARWCLLALALALLAVLPTAGAVAAGAAPAAASPVAYQPRIDGLTADESRLKDLMKQSGISFTLQSTPPETVDGLRRRAMQDVERFRQVMDSLGFYDGKVTFKIEDARNGEPRPLVFTVDPGSVYLLGDVLVQRGADAKPAPADTSLLDSLGLHIGMPAEAQTIIDGENKLIAKLQDDGHPFVEALGRRTVIHPNDKTMVVTYRIDPGPKATYGAVRIDGLKGVSEAYVRKYVDWKQGAAYDRRQLDKVRDALAETDLFSSVSVQPVKPVGKDGRVPVRIAVSERPPRSIGAGVTYSTSIGPGATAFWEHRNLFGHGERLRLSLSGSRVEQGAEGTFRKPLFFGRRQDLVANGELKNTVTNAFDEKKGSAFVGVERKIGKYWAATLGPTLEFSHVASTESDTGNFLLGGVRGGLRRTTVKDLLNPTQGSKLDLGLTPYTSLDSKHLRFVKSSVTGSSYYALDDKKHYILAGRARLGSILGGDPDRLPAGMRFYTGGGGSVRGYDYQTVGPLNDANEPIGGKSVLEFSGELRARVTDTVGVVPFVDAGNVYRHEVPQNFKLLWAAGIGLRYYTAVGPLRADLAFPLDRRSGVDSSFQFYFSLGQSF